MRKMNIKDALRLLCKQTKKYGLYLHFPSSLDGIGYFSNKELKKAVPFLNTWDNEITDPNETDEQAIHDEYMFVLCDSYEECNNLFNQVVGDDGPTKFNKYDGPCRVYALTINSDGDFVTENT